MKIMKSTDAVTIILFIVFLGVIALMIIFWQIGKLDYEDSATPKAIKEISKLVNENATYFWAGGAIVIVLLALIIFLKILKRTLRQEINVEVIRKMEKDIFPEGF